MTPVTSRPDGEPKRLVDARLAAAAAVLEDCRAQAESIASVGKRLIEVYRSGNKLIMFGNGGSAADCQHVVAEFTGRFYRNRRALPGIALTANVSGLTGIGNDFGFETLFERQIEAHGNPGDLAIGLSTSGKSANVLRGLARARASEITAVGMTGAAGREAMGAVSDIVIAVPSSDTPRIQEAHLVICHTLAEMVENAL